MTREDDSTATSPGPPEQILAGRYRLGEFIGGGGFGVVRRGFDLRDQTEVAVKLLLRESRKSGRRFEHEVATLRLLRIPGVVRFLDCGLSPDGIPFLVMELSGGSPFPGVSTPASWEAIAPATMGLLEVLDRVHARGFVHRDLKPSNVLVEGGARVTLLDFGISWGPELGRRITSDGRLVGTYVFMAPEQLEGAPLEPRCDLYAVGVMLYGALTGEWPFEHRSPHELLNAKLSRAAPRLEPSGSIPPVVADLVGRLLSRHPGDRPASATDVLAVLRGELPSQTSRPLPWLGSRAAVDALLKASLERRSIDLVGAPGAGKTRCLRELEACLRERGRAALWVRAGSRPFASVDSIVASDLAELKTADLATVRKRIEERIRGLLERGATVLVDDEHDVDPATRQVLEACSPHGCIVRTRRAPLRQSAAPFEGGDTHAVVLGPLDPEHLRALFDGPDRILHLRGDAASELHRRTRGWPGAVVREVGSWVRAGLCRWRDQSIAITRPAIDRLRSGTRLSISSAPTNADVHALPARLQDLLQWIALCGGEATVALLESLTGESRWEVEAGISVLRECGCIEPGHEGHFTALVPPPVLWPPARRQLARRRIVDALPAGTSARLLHLIELDSANEVVAEACTMGRRLHREGRLGDAIVALEEGLRAARAVGVDAALTSVLSEWSKVAFSESIPSEMQRVLHELDRCEELEARGLRALLVAGHSALTRPALEAWELLEGLEPLADPELELWRHAFRVLAGRQVSADREERALREAAEFIAELRDAEAEASLRSWRGGSSYRGGRFDEAARFHLEAAERHPRANGKLSALLNGAAALIEECRFDEARAVVEQALGLARTLRIALFEARAECLLRQVAYREGTAAGADFELVTILRELAPPWMLAGACLTEAAFAWRAGDLDAAVGLGTEAAEIWTKGGQEMAADLARLFVAMAADSEVAREDASAAVARAKQCSYPGLALQVLALAAPGVGADVARELAKRCLSELPAPCHDLRREILSPNECVKRIEGGVS